MKQGVYILQSQKNLSYYIGSTNNLERRLIEHNNGLVKATKHLMPWKLVLFQEYADLRLARQVEYKLKKFKSRKIIEKIISQREIKLGR